MKTDERVDPREVYRLCHRDIAFRPTTDGAATDGRTLEGYAAVFDEPTEIDSWEGRFEEVINPGAFKRTLRQRTPVMQFNHGNDKRTGAVPIGSIKDLREDEQGLFVRARLFDNELVEPIRQAVEGKAIRGMSFKFEVLGDRWVDENGRELDRDERDDLMDSGELVRREITEVKLYELGPVVFPAYDQTSVGVRSVFDPGQVAMRGVLAQFGLDARCVQRHLTKFDDDARSALAEEITDAFPELRRLIDSVAVEQRNDTPETSGSATEGTPATQDPPEPADSSTSVTTEPARGHSVDFGDAPQWYLPPPEAD